MVNVADGDDWVPIQAGQVFDGEPPYPPFEEGADDEPPDEGEPYWGGNVVGDNAQVGFQADTVVGDVYVGWS